MQPWVVLILTTVLSVSHGIQCHEEDLSIIEKDDYVCSLKITRYCNFLISDLILSQNYIKWNSFLRNKKKIFEKFQDEYEGTSSSDNLVCGLYVAFEGTQYTKWKFAKLEKLDFTGISVPKDKVVKNLF
uniref:Inhibitor_I29 domain-containing protein n=1 Tax=Heterorhabditis bacteriophora TaxID=37862 RepID=A0A1I7WWV8_HETBA